MRVRFSISAAVKVRKVLTCRTPLVSFWTAAQALFHEKRLALVEPPAKAPGDEWIFIYGGSCVYLTSQSRNGVRLSRSNLSAAVGHFAIQLAHLAGYKVVTTASPRNFELAKSLGADAVFDYRDADVVAKIKQATGDSVTKALDAISLKESQRISAEVLAPAGGNVVLVLGPEAGATDRKDVEFIRACSFPLHSLHPARAWWPFPQVELMQALHVHYTVTLIYTSLGREFSFGPGNFYPVSSEDRAQMVEFRSL